MQTAATVQKSKMTQPQFFSWMEFFRGATVQIGEGKNKVKWTLITGWFDTVEQQGKVTLQRKAPIYPGSKFMHTVRYTCAAERLRAA